MQKILVDSALPEISVLSVAKNSYRSGARFDIQIQFCWGAQTVDGKIQCYVETKMLQWDRSAETAAQLIARANVMLTSLKSSNTSEADLLFTIQNFKQMTP
jgi:hypothetical protein